MVLTWVILFTVVFSVLLYFLNLWLSHGKSNLSGYLEMLLFSLAVGIPVYMASFFIRIDHKPAYTIYLLLFSLVIVILVLVKRWYQVIKGRETVYQAFFLTAALFFIYISFWFSVRVAIILIITGYVFLMAFFVYLFRFPYLHSPWLNAVVDETAKEVRQKGKYSSKPIVIHKEFNKRFTTGARGLSLLIKKDRIIARMTSKQHRKLGEPNLEIFFEKLADRIINYKEEI